jgi:hypothetical protein
MIQIKSILNFVKTGVDEVIGCTRSKMVSLHFGAHRSDHRLDDYIQDFMIESTPDVSLSVADPIIEGYIHRHSFSDRAICRLRDATFDTDTGNVYLGRLLVRESNSFTSNHLFRKSADFIEHNDLPIIGVPNQTHYHWLIETLPRIISASQFEPKSKLISSSRTTDKQRKALADLGLDVLYSDARHHSNNLILATRGEDTGWAHPQDLDILRKTYKVPSTKGFRRILVSRVGSRRSDYLSQAIQDYAEKTGWTIVQSENLTWDEALSIYGEASVIAGEHGAGLANVALAPLGTQLIELQRHSYPNPCYAALSQSLNGHASCYSRFPIDQFEAALTLRM